MKQMTCRQLGGACDAVITGSTPEEMGENCRRHVIELKEQGDTSHDAAMEKMRNMSPEEFQGFMDEFHRNFEAAEEV